MLVFDQEKMLNRFIACIGTNSFLDIDGFYFLCMKKFFGNAKCTGLMAAISLGLNDLARTLIHYDANINLRGINRATTLHYAARIGNDNMVRILLDLGAHVNGGDTSIKRLYTMQHILDT